MAQSALKITQFPVFPCYLVRAWNRIAPDTAGSDRRPSKPRVAGSNPAGRASFPKEFAECPLCLGTRGEGTGEKSDRSAFHDWLTEVRPSATPRASQRPAPMAWCDVVEPCTLRECRISLGQSQAAFAATARRCVSRVVPDVGCRAASTAAEGARTRACAGDASRRPRTPSTSRARAAGRRARQDAASGGAGRPAAGDL